MNGRSIAILGGGVAGLSAAHELAERGFRVSIYERHAIVGGKSRSMAVPGTAVGGRRGLPGEHGFRYFPRFYSHVTDTMSRIPFGRNPRGVLDNLVDTTRTAALFSGRPGFVNSARFPRDVADLKCVHQTLFRNGLSLHGADVSRLLRLLLRVSTSCDERRGTEIDALTWSMLTDARQGSAGYQLLTGLTQLFVALRAEEISAKTTSLVLIRMIRDLGTPGGSADRVLNGPTSDVWLEPWREHLTRLGVEICCDAVVHSLHVEDGRIAGAVIQQGDHKKTIAADYFICALPVEVAAQLVTPELARLDAGLASLPMLRHHTRWMTGIQFFLRRPPDMVHGHSIHVDSPWALTSICSQQFWPASRLATYGDGCIGAVLTVDISDWDKPGVCGKTAKQCSAEEIRDEVWRQLEDSCNVGGQHVLDVRERVAWYLDPALHPAQGDTPASNDEPVFVNGAGTWALRPTAATSLPNLLLAGDYVRTATDLACMEGANEAARRAVNEILRRAGSSAAPCRLFPFPELPLSSPLRALDALRYRAQRAFRAAVNPSSHHLAAQPAA